MCNPQTETTSRPDRYPVAENANLASAGREFATGVNLTGGPSGGGGSLGRFLTDTAAAHLRENDHWFGPYVQ